MDPQEWQKRREMIAAAGKRLLEMDDAALRAITREQLKKELLAEGMQEVAASEHIRNVLAQCTESYNTRLRVLFEAKADPRHLVEQFETEPPIVRLAVWSRVTSMGIDEIDFAKFVHKHLAHAVLEVFFDEVPPYEPGGIHTRVF